MTLAYKATEVAAREFDAHEWARGHETLDEFRFKIIFSVLGVICACAIGVGGWSLKTQAEAIQQAQMNTTRQLDAIQRLQGHIDTAVAPALSNSGVPQ